MSDWHTFTMLPEVDRMRFVDVGGRRDAERLTGRYTEPLKTRVSVRNQSKKPVRQLCVRAQIGR